MGSTADKVKGATKDAVNRAATAANKKL